MSILKRVGLLAMAGAGLNATFDDRLIGPLNYYPWTRTPDRLSLVRGNLVFYLSNKARDCNGTDFDTCNLGGGYDLVAINKAMNTGGITNPLFLSEWSTIDKLPYNGWRKIRAEGIDGFVEYAVHPNISFSAAVSILQVSSWGRYLITSDASQNISGLPQQNACEPDCQNLSGTEQMLERARLKSNELLQINPGPWHKTGLSDLELYARFGRVTDHTWKINSSDLSVMLGVLLPTAIKANPYQPYSLSLGGVGGTGFFGRALASMEFGQDWFLGGWVDVCQRLSKTYCRRIPLGNEPLAFGTLIDRAHVKPGVTVTFSPWLILDCIQDGFGMYAWYLYTHHWYDDWSYVGTRTDVKPNMTRLRTDSCWTNECAAVGLVYDMTKMPTWREHGPRFTAEILFPVGVCGANSAAQTYRVSLGASCNF